jgi:hypothetical protein
VRSAVKEEKATKDSAARQMLGMKGAALETDKFKIRVQLTKPVTWVPLIWGASSLRDGCDHGRDLALRWCGARARERGTGASAATADGALAVVLSCSLDRSRSRSLSLSLSLSL